MDNNQVRQREVVRVDGTEWDIRSEHEPPDPWEEYHTKLEEANTADVTISGSGSTFKITAGTVYWFNTGNGEAYEAISLGGSKFVALGKQLGKTQSNSCVMDYWDSGSRASRRAEKFARRTRTEGWENALVQGRLQCGKGCTSRHNRTKGCYR
jgi:hypothetical protein